MMSSSPLRDQNHGLIICLFFLHFVKCVFFFLFCLKISQKKIPQGYTEQDLFLQVVIGKMLTMNVKCFLDQIEHHTVFYTITHNFKSFMIKNTGTPAAYGTPPTAIRKSKHQLFIFLIHSFICLFNCFFLPYSMHVLINSQTKKKLKKKHIQRATCRTNGKIR